MAELGQDTTEFLEEVAPNPRSSYFKISLEVLTLDLLPQIVSGERFKQAYEKKETIVIKDIELPFIGIDELLADKAANARSKDLTDIKQLKSLNKK